MSLTDPAEPDGGNFAVVGVTSRSEFKVDNLTPGTYYWFRVKAVGKNSASPFCDAALIMAA